MISHLTSPTSQGQASRAGPDTIITSHLSPLSPLPSKLSILNLTKLKITPSCGSNISSFSQYFLTFIISDRLPQVRQASLRQDFKL